MWNFPTTTRTSTLGKQSLPSFPDYTGFEWKNEGTSSTHFNKIYRRKDNKDISRNVEA